MPLRDVQIRSLRPADKVYQCADERGLYLEVHPNGSMLWRYKYRFVGKTLLEPQTLARVRRRIPIDGIQAFAPYKIRAVMQVLCEGGIDPEQALEKTGIPAESLNDPKFKTSVAQFLQVWGSAINLSRNPCIALAAGQHLKLGWYGMY